MSKPMVIEKIKSISLVVLFLSTVLLLYFFWGNSLFEKIKLPEVQPKEQVKLAQTMVKPDKIIVNFGADNYTVISDGNSPVWGSSASKESEVSMVSELDRFGKSEDILVKEITYSDYQEIMKFDKSIRAEFAYDIPLHDFFKNFGIAKHQSYNEIGAIRSIGYSTAYSDSIFVNDGKNQKYYQMKAKKDVTRFKSLIGSIESSGYITYYPMAIYLRGENQNQTLVPLTVESNMRSFPYKQDAYVHQTDKINVIAEKFFGENFDFTRTIVESDGTIIYMYGYGQKVLIVNTDGSFEYKEEQLNEGADQSFTDALTTAVDFINTHGSWESLNGAKMTPYLKDVISEPNSKEGYRFIFGMEVNGNRLFYEKGDAIIAEVDNGQVDYYKRNMIDFDQKDMEAIETASYDNTYSAVNLIAQNYEYIYSILLQEGAVKPSEDQQYLFEDIAALITDMQTGYMRPASQKEDNEVKPAWIVAFNNINIYFNLYDAKPLGYSID